MGRTRKLARATLDTADNLFLLGTLPVLDSGKLSEQIGFQTHRTVADALGTADAGLWLLAESLLIRDNRHRVSTLADGHLDTCQCLTHHWTTSQQLVVALRHTATSVNQVLHGRSHTNQEVARVLQFLTSNGGIALKQGLTLHNSLINGKGRTYVLHDGAHVDRNSGRGRHLTLDDSIYELLLTALRIALFQGHNLYVVFGGTEHLCTLTGK